MAITTFGVRDTQTLATTDGLQHEPTSTAWVDGGAAGMQHIKPAPDSGTPQGYKPGDLASRAVLGGLSQGCGPPLT